MGEYFKSCTGFESIVGQPVPLGLMGSHSLGANATDVGMPSAPLSTPALSPSDGLSPAY